FMGYFAVSSLPWSSTSCFDFYPANQNMEERKMKNYQDSDYALNKFSPNIVYRFADGTAEITPEDYLASNPGKTLEDFAELKALSDEIYYTQDRDDTRYGKRKRSMEGYEETEQMATPSLDVELIEKGDKKQAMTAAKQLLDSGDLTEVQRRRFILHFFQGLSTRQIGRMEGISHKNVLKSIQLAKEKLKKFFEK
ncbi:MAG: sigma factor-like helix-turn-helix DNA-binding protein, partial [Clostridia bacterium]